MTVTSKPLGERAAPQTQATAGIAATADQIAAQQSLPPQLLHSVIKVESNYNPLAVSEKGAQGLMQLVPATARRFGVSDVFDPVENIRGGAEYLRYLLDLYQGDYTLALAAYNAGEGAVNKYGGIPPYKETHNYVQLVRKQLEKAAANPVARPEPKPVETRPQGPPRIQQIVEPDGSVRYVSQ